jgi:hypothetical protein
MKLNHDSKTAKIYRWFYGLDSSDNLTNDGCEYFKKLALALVLFIPLALITLPITLIGLIYRNVYTIGERLGFMFFFCLVSFCLFAMGCSIAMFFVDWDKTSLICKLGPGGCLIWIVVIGVSLYQGIMYLIEYIKESRVERDEYGRRIYGKPKQDNLLVTYYKATKEKYCPKLEWYRKT